jgi:hypothetical protein
MKVQLSQNPNVLRKNKCRIVIKTKNISKKVEASSPKTNVLGCVIQQAMFVQWCAVKEFLIDFGYISMKFSRKFNG